MQQNLIVILIIITSVIAIIIHIHDSTARVDC